MYDRAGLTRQRRAFIEGLLRSLEAGTYLSEHVAGASSAVLALTRAHDALDGHINVNQPQIRLTRTVLSQALSDVASGVAAYSTTPVGGAWITGVQQILARVSASMAGAPSSTEKQQLTNQIGSFVKPAVRAIRSLFEAVWNGINLPTEIIARIRDEVSVLVVLEGRDGLLLREDLLRLFRHGVADSDAVADVLWPTHKKYRVALVLSGAQVLDGLDRLLPGAQQWPLVGANLRLGIPSWEVERLVEPMLADAASKMLILLQTFASDAYTAIAQARRDVAETLDQYTAGQRLLELTIGPRSVAITPNDVPLMPNPGIGGTKIARPLTSHWPTPLRSALRMANLADRMDAPVASTMLAWSAIESMGVKSGDFELIAKACALHSLRQIILSVYQSVTDSAIARLRFSERRIVKRRGALAAFETSHAEAVARGASPEAAEAAVRLESSAAQARAQLVEAESDRAQLEQDLMPSIEIVRQNLLDGGDQKNPLMLNVWRLPLNDFLDSILPLDAMASDDLRQTQEAVATLAREAGGLAEELLETWRDRLASPLALADWLNYQESMFHGQLAWMYASRNLAIHAGQFSIPADVLSAQSGRGIVDMVLEFLGHWYQDQRARGVPESEARAVLKDLAARKNTLENHLRNATSCHPLNIFTITAPNSDCWNRV